MSWIDQPPSNIIALRPSSFRGMALAFIPITARETFGIMTRCRETLDGRACERANEDGTARLWVFSMPTATCIVLAWITGQFFVGTRAQEEVLHVA
jgi:hypothetical protein